MKASTKILEKNCNIIKEEKENENEEDEEENDDEKIISRMRKRSGKTGR